LIGSKKPKNKKPDPVELLLLRIGVGSEGADEMYTMQYLLIAKAAFERKEKEKNKK